MIAFLKSVVEPGLTKALVAEFLVAQTSVCAVFVNRLKSVRFCFVVLLRHFLVWLQPRTD